MQLIYLSDAIEYSDAMAFFDCVNSIDNQSRNDANDLEKIYILEHKDVYTAGKSVNGDYKLFRDISIHKYSTSDLHVEYNESNHNVKMIHNTPVIYTDRGGLWTWHGKGQVVVYFIYDIKRRKLTLSDFMSMIGSAVVGITKCEIYYNKTHDNRFDIFSGTKERGFWIKNLIDNTIAKFGFIGLRIVNGFVIHGLSINYSNNLQCFDYISPCGLNDVRITSISEIKERYYDYKSLDIEEFKHNLGSGLFDILNSNGQN